MDSDSVKRIYFVGAHIGHSISNIIHNEVAQTLGLNWLLEAIDNDSLDEFLSKLHSPVFGGAIITMPHKLHIIPHLAEVDRIASLLGACNNIYRSADGHLVGTNTDWIGVRDGLVHLSSPSTTRNMAFIIGAGGAARAAVYALAIHLSVTTIYIINRDNEEVSCLSSDVSTRYRHASLPVPDMIHLRTPTQAMGIEAPYYGVGTVPDFPATTEAERTAQATLDAVLSRSPGVFLEMCYKPRLTRNLRAAKTRGWVTGEGIDIATWQLKEQWRLWAEEASQRIPMEVMARRVGEIADALS